MFTFSLGELQRLVELHLPRMGWAIQMTVGPRKFCPECEEELVGAINGLTQEHWDCAETRMAEGRERREDIKDKEWKPVPDTPEGPKANGWLAPDGQFYGCSHYAHNRLGEALAEFFYSYEGDGPSFLESKGWGHISDVGFHLRDRLVEPTQQQIDAVWDWFMTLNENDGRVHMMLKWFFEARREK